MTKRAIFAAGCFWGVEASFRNIKGVTGARVGYTGGDVQDPTYRQVCTGRTGHAEAVEVEYDPAVVSYEQLLEVFWDIHDPTTLNRQGPDIGSQYRSAIFYNSEEERAAALSSIDSIHRSGRLGNRRVVTQVVPAKEFYPAEEYHQRYLEKHGRASCRFC